MQQDGKFFPRVHDLKRIYKMTMKILTKKRTAMSDGTSERRLCGIPVF